MRLLISSVCLVVLLSGCARVPQGKDDKKPDNTSKGPTAEELSDEFKSDAQAADKKYKGTSVTITGEIVANMSKDATGQASVIIILKGLQKDDNPANDGPPIHCAIAASSESKTASLEEGHSIKVTGKYKKHGKEESATHAQIFVEDCQIEGVPNDLAITVSAADLAKAWAADENAAKKKYSGKIVLLEGKFIRTDSFPLVGNVCILEGDKADGKPFEIVALVGEETYQKLNAKQQGDQVQLRASCDGRVTMDNGVKYVRLTGAKLVK